MENERAYVLDEVWYRERPATESTPADPFVRQRGRLTVEPDGLRFEADGAVLHIRGVQHVRYGVHGTMTSPSVEVRYDGGGGARSAYFTDGRLGGYAGLFGGTRRLARDLQHLGPTTYDDAASRRSRLAMVAILLALLATFLLRLLR